MNGILIVVLVLGMTAPYLRAAIWRVPFSMLPISAVLRTSAATAVSTLLIGAVTLLLLLWLDTDKTTAGAVAAGTAAAGGALLLWTSSRRFRHAQAVAVLCHRLQEEDVQTRARKVLDRILGSTKNTQPITHAGLALAATGPLTQAGLWQDARAHLRSIDPAHLTKQHRAIREQALATCELHFNNVDGAQEAIARVERPAPEAIEVWLQTIDALLLVIGGRPEDALAALRESESEDPSVQASQGIVRAHVHAARGRLDDARKEITAIAEVAGRNGVERVLMPKGPASSLAEEWLTTLQ